MIVILFLFIAFVGIILLIIRAMWLEDVYFKRLEKERLSARAYERFIQWLDLCQNMPLNHNPMNCSKCGSRNWKRDYDWWVKRLHENLDAEDLSPHYKCNNCGKQWHICGKDGRQDPQLELRQENS